MRVNFDSKALGDPRFLRLAGKLKVTRHAAWGGCLPVWMHAYENRSAFMPATDVDALAELEGFAAAMVEVNLAESMGGDMVRLCGVRDRIEFLLQQDEKRALALEAKKAKKRPAAPSRKVIPGDGPNSPDPDLHQPPAQSGTLGPPGRSPGTELTEAEEECAAAAARLTLDLANATRFDSARPGDAAVAFADVERLLKEDAA